MLVFTNMLAHADAEGWVDIHPRAIAEEVGLSVEQVNAAINELEAPDPESRSPENEGRRIVKMDEHRSWGWVVVNYKKYRSIRNEEDRREQNRLAQQRFREKHNQSKPRKPMSAQVEGEEEGEGEAKEKSKAITPSALLAALGIPNQLAADYIKLRFTKKSPITKTAMDGVEREAVKAGITLEDAIRVSCERGWAGFKAEWFFKDGVKAPNGVGQADRVRERLTGGKNAT